ncbi:endolytic transglycosylase MltG [Chondromyces crocatus]|uniref:Endolytic murein transglycosylase n=1 Tax=Chondromyces crocatus TaxID=52 RepID=A0A0K1EI53_CHOCO|nr:endolytic transglycosylase MltG [Chondromyces crocatus]AKT40263.1 uncharacterized protein CMC5_044160 [Chondromyces crocatus]
MQGGEARRRSTAAPEGPQQPPSPPSSTRKQAASKSRGTRRKPRPGWQRALAGMAVGFALVALLTVGLVIGYGSATAPDHGGLVEINWPEGLDAEEAAALLASDGLVRGERGMALYLHATGGTEEFVPGPHLLWQGLSAREVRALLQRAPDRPKAKVVIPEGWNRYDIAARLEKLHVAGRRAFLAATSDAELLERVGIERTGSVGVESAEGYLFPATYEIPLDSDAREVARRLMSESDRRWKALATQHKEGLATLQASLGWGRREVLTLASIIEKEAVVDDERRLIASVFINRLLDPTFRSRRLQSDPTSLYGCVAYPADAPSCAGFTGKPTPEVVRDPKNRYSTYAHPGLPPGPIGNPGEASIVAALSPAATKYLYFVATGGGRHTFSESLEAHNEGVRRLRAASAGAPR